MISDNLYLEAEQSEFHHLLVKLFFWLFRKVIFCSDYTHPSHLPSLAVSASVSSS